MTRAHTDQRLTPAGACLRMGGVVLRLAWAYAVAAGPFVGAALIVLGVLIDHATLRYTGALVLGVTASILLSDLACGLSGSCSPLGIIPGVRRAGGRRRALVLPFAILLLASIAVSIWAAVRLGMQLLT
jgi:hypothetical protein